MIESKQLFLSANTSFSFCDTAAKQVPHLVGAIIAGKTGQTSLFGCRSEQRCSHGTRIHGSCKSKRMSSSRLRSCGGCVNRRQWFLIFFVMSRTDQTQTEKLYCSRIMYWPAAPMAEQGKRQLLHPQTKGEHWWVGEYPPPPAWEGRGLSHTSKSAFAFAKGLKWEGTRGVWLPKSHSGSPAGRRTVAVLTHWRIYMYISEQFK